MGMPSVYVGVFAAQGVVSDARTGKGNIEEKKTIRKADG